MSDKIIAEAQTHLKNIPVEVISQGAEAVVFTTTVHPYLPPTIKPNGIKHTDKYIIKFRPPKAYRHPILDAQLTKHRTLAEARLLQRLTAIENVHCPSIIAVDTRNGLIWMEFVGEQLENGQLSTLKNWLWLRGVDHIEGTESRALDSEVEKTLQSVGKEVGLLHLNDIVHGDLTSSNIVLQDSKPYLIDFGLGSLSTLVEDKAVDLYVLERAVLSTHPLFAESYNKWLMEGYASAYEEQGKLGKKKLKEVISRYNDVRMRGRKRSMLG